MHEPRVTATANTGEAAEGESGPGAGAGPYDVPRHGECEGTGTGTAAEAASGADARHARTSGAKALAQALQAARDDTLATFATYQAALPTLQVPYQECLNPPLWELGHVGWFQSWWLTRFAGWPQGWQADPNGPRGPEWRPGADGWYDSGRVTHERRWSLPLPDAATTRADLAGQLAAVLGLLAQVDDQSPTRDAQLYFFRLALFHEDMHHEAALYMAQTLGIAVDDARWQPTLLDVDAGVLQVPGGVVELGRGADEPGFAFDNEYGRCAVRVEPFEIDRQALRWCEFLPFVEEDGYDEPRWWSPEGWAWRQEAGLSSPRVLRRMASRLGVFRWERRLYGRWQPLRPDEAACHLTRHEAEAWCRWAGRRLPTEAEWLHAQRTHASTLRWGDVWEWTASAFVPFEGFEPHPYRDYSQPWFDGRPVLKGGSFMTQPRMKHPAYRNYFRDHRCDVPAGFRSCAA